MNLDGFPQPSGVAKGNGAQWNRWVSKAKISPRDFSLVFDVNILIIFATPSQYLAFAINSLPPRRLHDAATSPHQDEAWRLYLD